MAIELLKDQMFPQMLQAAKQRLAGRDPQQIAQNANVRFDAEAQRFCLSALGEKIYVNWPDCTIEPSSSGWLQLLLLHYLDLADGTALTGEITPFGQLKDGLIRGSGFDRKCESAIAALLRKISEDEFRTRCASLGGIELRSNADYAVTLPFLPNYPLTLKVWFADDEFDASGRMFVDGSADHYLTVEDAVTVGEVILERLSGAGYFG